jgi:hypothetical protein
MANDQHQPEAPAGNMDVDTWAERISVHPRTIRRWLHAGKVPGAVLVDAQWIIPGDAQRPADGRVIAGERRRAERGQVAEVARARGISVVNTPPMHTPSPAVYDAPSMARRFWYTVDDLVVMFDPLVSRHAIVQMLRNGELKGYPRGRNGAWIIPASELRRIMG